jgi:hypothetical protein
MRNTILVLASAAALAAAGAASAHARLIMSSPKAGESIAAPKGLALHYSESIVTAGSSVNVTGPGGAVVATSPLAVGAKDKRLVNVNFTGPVAHGAYKVHWHMKTEDGHETDGAFAFTVK